jgi:hypothetical protein
MVSDLLEATQLERDTLQTQIQSLAQVIINFDIFASISFNNKTFKLNSNVYAQSIITIDFDLYARSYKRK